MPDRDHHFLTMAARLALRGHGGAEPNPLVGCVIERDGTVVGWGYHRRVGGPHAEIEALARAGARARDATVHLTLEPCNHVGRTGPCSEALVAAGVRRVVIARRDPHPEAGGGADRLRAAGVAVETVDGCVAATSVSDPFVHRLRTGLPWVVAKWAQTVDGRIATRSGKSRWISGAASRRLVHRERGRVDVILTGIGTVVADDPQLTARGVRVRRVARRVVVDPALDIRPETRLVATASRIPTTIACERGALTTRAEHAASLCAAGMDVVGFAGKPGDLPLGPVLRDLVTRYDVTTVLVEGGGRLLGRLFRQDLVREAWVFLAPQLLGDERAVPCVGGLAVSELTEGIPLSLTDERRRGDDLALRYRVSASADRRL